jgi:PIN domain nuclease of toxin-antitoxin system
MGGPQVILLDTHAWVWWVSSPGILSEQARKAIDHAAANESLTVSSISVWEVAMLVARGRLRLTMEVNDWITQCEAFPFVRFIPVDNRIALKSVTLPDFSHPDPADRIIIATSIILEATLVTKDQKMLNYPHVKTIRA